MLNNLVENFLSTFSKRASYMTGIVINNYRQFPKVDANRLSTHTLWSYCLRHELMIPWNIIILDNDQEDCRNYSSSPNKVEVIFVFRVDETTIIQASLDAWTRELLIEGRKLINEEWLTMTDAYHFMQKM